MKRKEVIFNRIIVLVIMLLFFTYSNCYAVKLDYNEDIKNYNNINTVNTSNIVDNSFNNFKNELKNKTIHYDSIDVRADDYNVVPSGKINNIIGLMINLIRIIGVFLSFLLIIIVAIKRNLYGKKYYNILKEEQKKNENINIFLNNLKADNDYIELIKKHEKVKKYSIISVLAFLGSFIIIANYKGYNAFIESLPTISFILFLILINIKHNVRTKIDVIENTYFKQIDNNDISKEILVKKEKYEKIKAHTIFYVIAAIMLLAGVGILSIIRSFKPIIYLYPEQEQVVTIELENKELLTTTYPKYEEKWEVLAKPNGDLVDLKTGRNLYALYWEGNKKKVDKSFDKGWCIKGEDSSKFLEEKLAELGLNEREAEEFIVYWLPKLEENEYNLIKFETQEQIDYNMPLNITPKPDTLIRVMMNFKGVKSYKELEPQELLSPERIGFTVVEWGGSEIK